MKRFLSRAATALAAAGLLALPVHAAEFINVLTGGTSGVYYPLGVALADLSARRMPGRQGRRCRRPRRRSRT